MGGHHGYMHPQQQQQEEEEMGPQGGRSRGTPVLRRQGAGHGLKRGRAARPKLGRVPEV